MNRVQHSIDVVRSHFAELDADKLASIDSKLALDFGEHFDYQEVQALAHASGKLTTEEALIVYAALGEVGSPSNGGWSSGVETATKYAITLTIEGLVKARVEAARAR
jgi:hypothetical protein